MKKCTSGCNSIGKPDTRQAKTTARNQKKLKIDCLLSVIPFDILKTTKIIENFSEISRIFSEFINFWRFFLALNNPQWFPDARSHWEVKITARKPANLVENFQKFTAEHHPEWGVFNMIFWNSRKLQILKKFCNFEKNALLSVITLHNLTPGRPKITARNQKNRKFSAFWV